MSVKKKLSAVLFSLGIFSNFVGIPVSDAIGTEENDIILTQNMGKQIANERLLINKEISDENLTMMYHYSHRSHSSHYSHRSHTSHYSSHY